MRPTESSTMMQVDLSTLRGPELRQLLDATRRRGQAKLSYEILQEMEARRARGGQPSPEPRLVPLNLGDPMDPDEEELGPIEASHVEPEPDREPAAPAAEEAEPLRLERDPARPAKRARAARAPKAAPPPTPERAPRPKGVWGRRVRWAILGLLAGGAAGYVFGFWVGTDGRAVSPAAAPPLQVAAVTPPPAPPVAAPAPDPAASEAATAISPQVAPAEAAPAATSAAPSAAPAAPAASAPIPAPVPAPVPAPAAPIAAEPPAKAEVASAAPTAPPAPKKGCAGQATPADQAICGDPKLKRLQAELRAAYAEALAAHEDKALLRERQLAWADARDNVSDPARLARLYEERIRKLNAATAEALAAR